MRYQTYMESTPGSIALTIPGAGRVISADYLAAQSAEIDPNGKQQHEPGAKLDQGKPPIWQGALSYFPRSLASIAKVSAIGARKYAWKGWESVPDGFNRYSNALARHFLAESWEEVDTDTQCLHAEQVAWNSCARLELLLKAKEQERKEFLGDKSG